jgi:hypothetical protein
VLHFDSAIPVMFVFSALVYWYAGTCKLPTADVERHIAESQHEAELEDEQLGAAL